MSEQYLLRNYDRYPLTVDRGEGCYVFDPAGRRYLDMISGIGVNAFGYSHPRLNDVLIQQAQRCIHTSNLVSNPYQDQLAERLCKMSGMDRAFFSNSGTEAMEAAIKAVRARSEPGRSRFVALQGSFHGRTMASLSVTGQPELRQRFVYSGADVTFVKPNDYEALEAAIDADTAAVVLEPVLGEGGIHPLDVEFLELAGKLTQSVGAYLIADEVQCGLGRTGKYFAYQWAMIRPNIVVTAKPLAAGLPLGATLFTEDAAQWLPPHSHGSTFGGGPLACRVALEVLDMVQESLPHVCEISNRFRARLEALRQRHPVIREIRSKGLMFGIQLSQPGRPIVDAALERGLLLNCTQETVLRLLPPYIVTEPELDAVVRILHQALRVNFPKLVKADIMAMDEHALAASSVKGRAKTDTDPRPRPDGHCPPAKPHGAEGDDQSGDCQQPGAGRVGRRSGRSFTGRITELTRS
jgi:predicted acetylornithine/succinylornithine family transaminase